MATGTRRSSTKSQTSKPVAKPKYKYVNGIQCPRCEEKLWSKYTHDFHYCGCGYCFVDGGRSYLRYGWGVKSSKPNDGSITKKEWEDMRLENEKIGKPTAVKMRVPVSELEPEQKSRWPY